MGDRNILQDRTLVLRITVPLLEEALRDKMQAAEDQGNSTILNNDHNSNKNRNNFTKEGQYSDLDGVTCQPSPSNVPPKNGESEAFTSATLWNFHCDGITYPARLVNLPCPVELHKTLNHATYYKSVDVAQMLIVYEDRNSMEDAEIAPGYKNNGFPAYEPDGLTPPMAKVVERRFANREHKYPNQNLPPQEVAEVEKELNILMSSLSNDGAPGKKGRGVQGSSGRVNKSNKASKKIHEEIFDEVVDYEPWMDHYGAKPAGVEFEEGDEICKLHPEVWLDKDDERKWGDKSAKVNQCVMPSSSSAVDTTSSLSSSVVAKKGSVSMTGNSSVRKEAKNLLPQKNNSTNDSSSNVSTSSSNVRNEKKPTKKGKDKKKKKVPVEPEISTPREVIPADSKEQEVDDITAIAKEMQTVDVNEMEVELGDLGFDFGTDSLEFADFSGF